MKAQVHLPIPVIKALRKLGKNINHARRRRRITIQLMAERAGLSKATISKIEKGDPTTSIGGYSAVLFVLGMTDRLSDLMDATHDLIGIQLEEEKLPQRVRFPGRKKNGGHHEQ
ncbi:MAG: family transcriptional regulator [Gammaproteobacteria bacterium]|jgi:transcriptional regulator with XRE-family HTH domain|nr:family transcriptional regulator [Gammaproteobacteria bacterium]